MNIDRIIAECFDGTEWHLSLWFPRVVREVVGLRAEISDAEAQRRLIRMIDDGILEAGAVEGAEFAARPLELKGGRCPDLYVRLVTVNEPLLTAR